jgi:NAD(P)-dependent dehydrogenase (short-subunit alcohol dehydrogenase family)
MIHAPSNGRLGGKIAIVAGAARGTGRATVFAFAREGAVVAGIDIGAVVSQSSGVKPATPDDLEQTGA